MTITVANTLLTNSMDYLINRTNELAHSMSNYVITTESNTTIGNASIIGTFTANVFFSGNSTVNVSSNSTAIKISNSTANVVLTNPTSTQISNGYFFLNANSSWTYIHPILTTSGLYNTSGTTQQEVDSYPISENLAAEYVVRVKDVSNNYYVAKLLTTYKESDVYLVEYGAITTNNSVGVFDVSSNTTHIKLLFTPTASSSNVNFTRTVV